MSGAICKIPQLRAEKRLQRGGVTRCKAFHPARRGIEPPRKAGQAQVDNFKPEGIVRAVPQSLPGALAAQGLPCARSGQLRKRRRGAVLRSGCLLPPAAFQLQQKGKLLIKPVQRLKFRRVAGEIFIFTRKIRIKPGKGHARRIGGEQRHQRVLIQQKLGGVHRIFAFGGDAWRSVEISHVRKGGRVLSGAGAKPFVHNVRPRISGVIVLSIQLHAVKRCQQIGLAAVVAPGGGKYGAYPIRFAGVQPGKRRRAHLIHSGCGPHPCPKPARKHHGRTKLGMDVQKMLVHRLLVMVVVPINEGDIPTRRAQNIRRQLPGNIVVTSRRRGRPQVHVAPYHRLQTVFLCDGAHAGKMLFHQLV